MLDRNRPEEELLRAIEGAIRENNVDDLEQYANDVDLWLADKDRFSDSLFKGLLSVIASPAFLSVEEGFHIFRIFANNIALMTDLQKTALLGSLENNYPKLKDP